MQDFAGVCKQRAWGKTVKSEGIGRYKNEGMIFALDACRQRIYTPSRHCIAKLCNVPQLSEVDCVRPALKTFVPDVLGLTTALCAL